MGKIDHHPVVDYFAVDHFPEIHVTNLDAFACGRDAHKLAVVRGFLAPKSRSPFAHVQPRFVDANFVAKGGLKGLLPIVLKLAQALLAAAALVAQPAKALGKKLANIGDAVVVQTIDHGFDDRARFGSFAHVSVAAEHGLLGSRSSHFYLVPTELPTYRPTMQGSKLGAQQLVDLLGVGLALALLHHLTDEEAKESIFALAVLRQLLGVGGDYRVDDFVELAAV